MAVAAAQLTLAPWAALLQQIGSTLFFGKQPMASR